MTGTRGDISLFGTCPPSVQQHGPDYLRRVREVAGWSDRAGYEGVLVYTDNRSVDPWLLAQTIIQATTRLAPLVAVQPAYMHPFTAAKLVAGLAYLHQRRVHLNMVAGGFTGDLQSLGEHLAHDDRYDRAVEYALIVRQLLTSEEPVSFAGAYYSVTGLRLETALPAELVPRVLFSGSSAAGMAAARAASATAVAYPQEPGKQAPADPSVTQGLRIGIITRPTSAEAWEVALTRFPEDRAGQISHRLATSRSDSQWHRQLAAAVDRQDTYWMRPFKNYRTFCPYLVGDYVTVGREVGRYLDLGYTTLILDTPEKEQDLEHIAVALDIARTRAEEHV
ncbi:LLM class flavin-dependent oxidoreductase [Actinoplanes sp. N902-109]|uniref:LLM class flavin-dependent oxidoreductase n=1 Tax=Actinoplanes sp. (strain N902-109) TaxID=649831 RepID=UPI0003296248|nr:LLM class flavin-dependent oxidoreductase [Actinoplanes sp. N902-109]AGL16379.1 putative alkanesulfonate monooxygenase [Actinoplanes sp. N902-109]